MDVFTVRPKVAQLTFQVLGRSVHPELFHIYKSQRIERENYSARIFITVDGHVISWTGDNTTLTEIASSTHQELPAGRRIVMSPLVSHEKQKIEYRDGLHYQYEYALERVPAEMFWLIQKQLGEAGQEHELLQVFDSSGRVAIGGLSFIHVDTRLNSLHIQAVHTFPDDMALLRTESTFSIVPTKKK